MSSTLCSVGKMNGMKRGVDILPIVLMGSLFVLVDLSAFLVAGPFETAGAVAFENPGAPLNLAYFFYYSAGFHCYNPADH